MGVVNWHISSHMITSSMEYVAMRYHYPGDAPETKLYFLASNQEMSIPCWLKDFILSMPDLKISVRIDWKSKADIFFQVLEIRPNFNKINFFKGV